ncbi:MAG: serine hydrolase domain-containing protein [Planctomycetota bacterium]
MTSPAPLCSAVALLAVLPPVAAAAGLPLVDPADAGMRADHLAHIAPAVEAELAAGQFAGAVVAIGRGGPSLPTPALVYLRAFGDRMVLPERRPMKVDTVFDLASLTKPVATATSIMVLLERGRLRLADPVQKHLPEIADPHGRQITIERLLTHHSGYIPDNPLADYRLGPEEAWRRLFQLSPVDPPGTRFRYSDVNFELLGKVVERVAEKPLDEFAAEQIFRPLGMSDTGFRPSPELAARAAATEPRSVSFGEPAQEPYPTHAERKPADMLCGEVHDPRAALLGGVAGHAGLFSTAGDLARYAAMMLGAGKLGGGELSGHGLGGDAMGESRVLSPATVAEFTRPRDVSGARRTAGWDARSGYSSNRGELMSPAAYGHGGFTGTSLWIDPGHDLFVIFLSSRLHPDGRGSVNPLAGRIGTIAVAAIE